MPRFIVTRTLPALSQEQPRPLRMSFRQWRLPPRPPNPATPPARPSRRRNLSPSGGVRPPSGMTIKRRRDRVDRLAILDRIYPQESFLLLVHGPDLSNRVFVAAYRPLAPGAEGE